MRRTPLLLAFFGAVVAILAISTSAAAAGKAVGQTKSAQASQQAQAATSKSHPTHSASALHSSSASTHSNSGHASSSSPSTGGAAAANKFNCAQPDQDVPGASCDPSSNRGTEQTDHGKGNDCDPGYGGSNPKGTGPDHGNDNRYPNSSETEVPGCGSTAGQTPPPVVIPPPPAPPVTGGVLGLSGGHGGGGEFGGGVSGATGMGGVGGAVAGATGVALANTGLRSVGFALLALLLIILGFFLIRRRGATGTA